MFFVKPSKVKELREEVQRLQKQVSELQARTGFGFSLQVPLRPLRPDEYVVSTSMAGPPLRKVSTTAMLAALLKKLGLEPVVVDYSSTPWFKKAPKKRKPE